MNYAWIQGTRFYWVNRGKIYSVEGSLTGASNVSRARAMWLEGSNLCYYDANGQGRRVAFRSMNPVEKDVTQILRAMWAPEGGYLEFRDARGERRRLVHNDHSDSSHGDYQDYEDAQAYSDITHQDKAAVDRWFFYDQPAEYHQYSEEVDHSDLIHSDHNDHADIDHQDHLDHADSHTDWPDYTDVDHSDHTDHMDNPYQDYADAHSDHMDWSDYTNIDHSDYDDHLDNPYDDYFDHIDSPWVDWDNHTDNPHDDHSDEPPYVEWDDSPWYDLWSEEEKS